MIDKETVEVYNRKARQWAEARSPRDLDHVAWVEDQRRPGAVVDIGCGPGWSLPPVTEPAVALDASSAMLGLAAENAPHAARVLAGADALPFGRGTVGGAVANRVYLHLPLADVPSALADLQGVLALDAPVFVRVMGGEQGSEFRASRQFSGRLFSGWSDTGFRDVCEGAGFEVEWLESHRPGELAARLRRAFTLPDTIGAGMRLLVCGLNPSIYSAEVGIGFARPGNRFWPAVLAAGVATRDRDPNHALTAHGVGMTDMVKRATRQAAELSAEEYHHGFARLERLTEWLKPAAVCFVGLAGWRAAVDRRASAGIQPIEVGGVPVYLMPSTSGLNAGSSLAELTQHFRHALDLAEA